MSNFFENDQVLSAYHSIANEILAFVGERLWDEAGAEYVIYSRMVESSWWVKKDECVEEGGGDIPREILDASSDGILFLRDYILNATGDRIWGISFSLYPSGVFNIKYDYSVPDGYEESDDFISGKG